MNEKYLIRLGEEDALAFRYNLENRRAVIGGLARLREDMEAIIVEYFKVPLTEPIFPAKRKMRYEFRLSKSAFDGGMARMKESGIIERVKEHGRLMR